MDSMYEPGRSRLAGIGQRRFGRSVRLQQRLRAASVRESFLLDRLREKVEHLRLPVLQKETRLRHDLCPSLRTELRRPGGLQFQRRSVRLLQMQEEARLRK